MKHPRRLTRTLRKATRPTPQERYASATEWKQALTATPGKHLIAAAIGISIVGLSALAWTHLPGQKPAIKLVNDANSPNHGLPEGAPLHPVQLVHYDDNGRLNRYNDSPLPPREEAFLQRILAAQEQYDKDWQEADAKPRKDDAAIHRMNWITYKLQEKLNNTVAQEIENYMALHYQGGDPYPEWTQTLIALVKETNLYLFRPILKPEYEPKD